MDYQKRISIDLNYYHLSAENPTISIFEVEHFELHDGDKIIGYQDDQEWEGTVRYNPSFPEEKEWYLDISNGKEYSVSLERMEGRSEGGRAAMPTGEIKGEMAVVSKMLADGMDINTVKKYTRLSRTRLENIVKNLSRNK